MANIFITLRCIFSYTFSISSQIFPDPDPSTSPDGWASASAGELSRARWGCFQQIRHVGPLGWRLEITVRRDSNRPGGAPLNLSGSRGTLGKYSQLPCFLDGGKLMHFNSIAVRVSTAATRQIPVRRKPRSLNSLPSVRLLFQR